MSFSPDPQEILAACDVFESLRDNALQVGDLRKSILLTDALQILARTYPQHDLYVGPISEDLLADISTLDREALDVDDDPTDLTNPSEPPDDDWNNEADDPEGDSDGDPDYDDNPDEDDDDDDDGDTLD